MDYFEKIRKVLEEGSEKIIKSTDKIVEKVKKVGEEGLEVSKEWFAEISDKTSEVASITRYKFDLNNLQKSVDNEYKNLGELCKKLYASRKKESLEKSSYDGVYLFSLRFWKGNPFNLLLTLLFALVLIG